MRLKDHLYLLEYPDNAPRLSRICKVAVKMIDNNGVRQDLEKEEISIHRVLETTCQEFDIADNFVVEDILVDREKSLFSEKIKQKLDEVAAE